MNIPQLQNMLEAAAGGVQLNLLLKKEPTFSPSIDELLNAERLVLSSSSLSLKPMSIQYPAA